MPCGNESATWLYRRKSPLTRQFVASKWATEGNHAASRMSKHEQVGTWVSAGIVSKGYSDFAFMREFNLMQRSADEKCVDALQESQLNLSVEGFVNAR